MNNVSITGNLVRDPDIRYTSGEQSTCVARYVLAVNRRYKKEGQPTADFIPCLSLGKNGEFAEQYFHKGMKVAVTGHIQTGSYVNKDGNKVYTTDVLVDYQEFLEPKQQDHPRPVPEHTAQEAFMDLPEDSELGEMPFR